MLDMVITRFGGRQLDIMAGESNIFETKDGY